MCDAQKIEVRGRTTNNSLLTKIAHVAQLVEHILGKDEVISSILVMGSFYFIAKY